LPALADFLSAFGAFDPVLEDTQRFGHHRACISMLFTTRIDEDVSASGFGIALSLQALLKPSGYKN